MDYKKCVIYEKGVCGPYKRKSCEGLFLQEDLTENLCIHFKYLKIKKGCENVTEKELIENRINNKLGNQDFICAHHRYTNGSGWKQPKRCYHPNHEKQAERKKSCSVRTLPLELLWKINIKYPEVRIPIGAAMCYNHIKDEQSMEQTVEVLNQSITDDNDTTDPDFVSKEINISDDILSSTAEIGNALSDTLDASPVRFKITKKKVTDLSDHSRKYLKRKYMEYQKLLTKRFAESVAPGQADEFISTVIDNDGMPDEEIPAELQRFLKPYLHSDAFGRMVILSLVDHDSYSKEYLIKVFNCSMHCIAKARKFKEEKSGVAIPKKDVVKRDKLDIVKCEHFLDFIFDSGLLQDVAYGVNKIKYDNGDEQKVANAILTTKYSHAIYLYVESCEQTGYKPLSNSSLWRILNSIKPSRKTSLAGLDDVTAEGMNGFETLMQMSSRYGCRELTDSLEKGKRYLKTQYPLHCSDRDTTVATHSTRYALSDPTNKDLCVKNMGEYPDVCLDCFNLVKTIQQVKDLVNDMHASEDDVYDVSIAIKDIFNYIKHLMRDSQQKKAKSFCFDLLDNTTCFWLKDYCQKILPVKFREGQKDYFGKKGISNHVDIFFTKEGEELKKYVYFTLIYRCDQSLPDTLCIAENVLKEFRKDEPLVQTIFTKSDNAGSYHGNFACEALHKICKDQGFSLNRYDYNEPCKGKDQCDRESAAVKSIMRSYVDAGKDIVSAEDVFQSFHYGQGARNAKVCVVQIDKEKTVLSGQKIKNVSTIHSIKFEDKSMRLWRYFEIGKGIQVNYGDVSFTSGLSVILPFSKTDKRSASTISSKAKKARPGRELCKSYFCTEYGCSEVFDDQSKLENHVVAGTHTFIQATSSMDKVKQAFVARMMNSSQSHLPESLHGYKIASIDVNTACDLYPALLLMYNIGWALPVRSNFRYSFIQKTILYKIFIDGEKSNKKTSAEQAQQLMRKDLSPDQYVTVQQIKSLFSRWSKLYREGMLTEPVETADQENEADLESDEESEEECHEEADTIACQHELLLKEHAENIMEDLAPYRKDEWVAVTYDNSWFPGLISSISDDGIFVNCMEYVTKNKNCFRWPCKVDICCYEECDVFCHLSPPFPTNARYFGLPEDEFLKVSEIFKRKN